MLTDLFWKVVTELGTAAVISGAVAYIAKKFFDHLLKRDLEHEKAALREAGAESLARLQDELRRDLERDLVSRKGEIDAHLVDRRAEAEQSLSAFKAELDQAIADRRAQVDEKLRRLDATLIDRRSFDERVRAEIERWANPILGSVQALSNRLDNILFDDGFVALAENYEPGPEWSIDHAYMLQTTVYLFGQFFCWSRLLDERLRFDLFRSQAQKDRFRGALQAVGEPLGKFPFPECEALPAGDLQVFSGQRRAMGEALIVERGPEPTCMRLAEFLDQWNEDAFRNRFAPLVALLTGLQPNSKRWLRLERAFDALRVLEQACIVTLEPRQG